MLIFNCLSHAESTEVFKLLCPFSLYIFLFRLILLCLVANHCLKKSCCHLILSYRFNFLVFFVCKNMYCQNNYPLPKKEMKKNLIMLVHCCNRNIDTTVELFSDSFCISFFLFPEFFFLLHLICHLQNCNSTENVSPLNKMDIKYGKYCDDVSYVRIHSIVAVLLLYWRKIKKATVEETYPFKQNNKQNTVKTEN